jgi:hypothetical protein
VQLTRLTYVYGDDPGTLGRLLSDIRGTLRFGEGSGLVELNDMASRGPLAVGAAVPEASVRVTAVSWQDLAPDVREELRADDVPCILGHAGTQTVLLLPPRSIARWSGGLNDLRGKVRFALARHGWTL